MRFHNISLLFAVKVQCRTSMKNKVDTYVVVCSLHRWHKWECKVTGVFLSKNFTHAATYKFLYLILEGDIISSEMKLIMISMSSV